VPLEFNVPITENEHTPGTPLSVNVADTLDPFTLPLNVPLLSSSKPSVGNWDSHVPVN
jgi:hypothetical protein